MTGQQMGEIRAGLLVLCCLCLVGRSLVSLTPPIRLPLPCPSSSTKIHHIHFLLRRHLCASTSSFRHRINSRRRASPPRRSLRSHSSPDACYRERERERERERLYIDARHPSNLIRIHAHTRKCINAGIYMHTRMHTRMPTYTPACMH